MEFPAQSGDMSRNQGLKGRVFERSQGCWNCVDGSALILTPHGGVRLGDGPIDVINNEQGFQTTNGWTSAGVQPVVEVLTTYGQRLRMTQDHRVATERGWLAAADLKPGLEVVGMQETVIGSKPIDDREALLHGVITGDGWKTTLGVGFGYRTDGPDWATMQAYARERFESRAVASSKNNGSFMQIEWRTAAARKWAEALDKNHVPSFIWTAQISAIGAYLRGLFSTDGNLHVKHPIYALNRPQLTSVKATLYQANETLIREVQLLLRMIGITSSVSCDIRQPTYKDLWALHIARRQSLLRFVDVVGFDDVRRTNILNEAVAGTKDRNNTPERIKQVVGAGQAEVFDISVPEGESFYANGILVHNCRNWDNGSKAKQYWEQFCKPRMLAQATEVALKAAGEGDLRGSQHPGVQQITKTTQDAGRAIARGKFGLCMAGGVQSDFVEDTHLCSKWSGKTGASVARAGGALDLLPDELRDKVDGSDS